MVLSGAPEEWFALVLEAGMALRYGQLPAILNYSVMMQSIASKIGHSRSVDSRGGINHHADTTPSTAKTSGLVRRIWAHQCNADFGPLSWQCTPMQCSTPGTGRFTSSMSFAPRWAFAVR